MISKEMSTLFDIVYCINLERRPDRWKEFLKGLPGDWPWPKPTQVRAIDGQKLIPPKWWSQGKPAWGCYRSHLRILEDALNNDINSILLLEDDAIFIDGFTEKMQKRLESLPDDWCMIYLGGQNLKVNENPPEKINEYWYRPFNVNRTHAFAIRGKKMMQRLYSHLTTNEWNKEDHLDHHLGRLHEERKDPIYIPDRWLVGQKAGRSDINYKESKEMWWNHAVNVSFPPQSQPFIAVLGLHSSGSSCIAGVLYHLGIHLGNKLIGYYGTDPEKNCGFEAITLRWICEQSLPFPQITLQQSPEWITKQLRDWINHRRREAITQNTIAGGKYPQLSAFWPQLQEICGEQLYIVNCIRPVSDSVASIIHRQNAKGGYAEKLEGHQYYLDRQRHQALSQVDSKRVLDVDYYTLLKNPGHCIRQKIVPWLSSIGLKVIDEKKIHKAINYVKPEMQHVR